MDKFAMVKEAEVRGVLAAFHDNGLVDFGDRETFDKIASVVSEVLPNEYSIDDIAGATSYIMNGGLEKDAEEEMANQAQMALGELALMKVAGEIDDAEFENGVESIVKEAAEYSRTSAFRKTPEKKPSMGQQIKSILKGEEAAAGARGVMKNIKGYRKAKNSGKVMKALRSVFGGSAESYKNAIKKGVVNTLKGAGKTGLAYGAIAGGVGGAGYGAKKLYDYISD